MPSNVTDNFSKNESESLPLDHVMTHNIPSEMPTEPDHVHSSDTIDTVNEISMINDHAPPSQPLPPHPIGSISEPTLLMEHVDEDILITTVVPNLDESIDFERPLLNFDSLEISTCDYPVEMDDPLTDKEPNSNSLSQESLMLQVCDNPINKPDVQNVCPLDVSIKESDIPQDESMAHTLVIADELEVQTPILQDAPSRSHSHLTPLNIDAAEINTQQESDLANEKHLIPDLSLLEPTHDKEKPIVLESTSKTPETDQVHDRVPSLPLSTAMKISRYNRLSTAPLSPITMGPNASPSISLRLQTFRIAHELPPKPHFEMPPTSQGHVENIKRFLFGHLAAESAASQNVMKYEDNQGTSQLIGKEIKSVTGEAIAVKPTEGGMNDLPSPMTLMEPLSSDSQPLAKTSDFMKHHVIHSPPRMALPPLPLLPTLPPPFKSTYLDSSSEVALDSSPEVALPFISPTFNRKPPNIPLPYLPTFSRLQPHRTSQFQVSSVNSQPNSKVPGPSIDVAFKISNSCRHVPRSDTGPHATKSNPRSSSMNTNPTSTNPISSMPSTNGTHASFSSVITSLESMINRKLSRTSHVISPACQMALGISGSGYKSSLPFGGTSCIGPTHPDFGNIHLSEANHPVLVKTSKSRDISFIVEGVSNIENIVLPSNSDTIQLDKNIAQREKADASDMNRARNFVVEEILQTEKTYLNYLHILVEFFIVPLRLPVDGELVISKKEHQILFSNVEVLLGIHSRFYESLKLATGSSSDMQKIAHVFLVFAPFLKLYAQYMINYNHYVLLYKDLVKQKRFRKIIDDGLVQSQCQIFDLPSLIVMPVQRLPRYLLLLQELWKKTPKTHVDYPELEESLQVMKDAIQWIETQVSIAEDLDQCAILEKKIIFDYNAKLRSIVTPTRRYRKETPIVVYINDTKHIADYIVMFNDALLLLILKKKGYIYQGLIHLQNVQVSILDFIIASIPKFGICLECVHFKPSCLIQLAFASQEERSAWIPYFQDHEVFPQPREDELINFKYVANPNSTGKDEEVLNERDLSAHQTKGEGNLNDKRASHKYPKPMIKKTF